MTASADGETPAPTLASAEDVKLSDVTNPNNGSIPGPPSSPTTVANTGMGCADLNGCASGTTAETTTEAKVASTDDGLKVNDNTGAVALNEETQPAAEIPEQKVASNDDQTPDVPAGGSNSGDVTTVAIKPNVTE
jgi:hypothetical protein